MKKVLAICLMMALVLSMSVIAFAEPGKFVSSPSGNPAPIVVSFDPDDDDCTAELVVTPYGDRDELSDKLRTMFENAYDEIVNADDLTKLNDALAKLVKDKGIDSSNLAVSDLFDLHIAGCDYHEGHVGFDITLDADTLKHFVGLIHMREDGNWELVEDAEVINDGEHLHFSVDGLSPFAIVIDTSDDVPQTGDNSMIHVYVIIMAVSALAIVLIVAKRRKDRV